MLRALRIIFALSVIGFPALASAANVTSELETAIPSSVDVIRLIELRDNKEKIPPPNYQRMLLALAIDFMNVDISHWNAEQEGQRSIRAHEQSKPPNKRVEHRFYRVFMEDVLARGDEFSTMSKTVLGSNRDLRFITKFYHNDQSPKVRNHFTFYLFDPTKLGKRDPGFYLKEKLPIVEKFFDALTSNIDVPLYRLDSVNFKIDPINMTMSKALPWEIWKYQNFMSTFDPQRTSDVLPDKFRGLNLYEGAGMGSGYRPFAWREGFSQITESHQIPPNTIVHTNLYDDTRSDAQVGTPYMNRMGRLVEVLGSGSLFFATKTNMDLSSVTYSPEELEALANAQRNGDLRIVIKHRVPQIGIVDLGKPMGILAEIEKVIFVDLKDNDRVVLSLDQSRLQ